MVFESSRRPEVRATEPPQVGPRRLLLVDGDQNARRGLSEFVRGDPELLVCAEAGTLAEALEVVRHERPDVVIAEMVFRDGDAFELMRRARKLVPAIRVLVLSARHEVLGAERLLRAGALGYVMKSAPLEEIRRAIRQVVAGEMHISTALGVEFQRRFLWPDSAAGRPPACALEVLSTREFQVFQLMGHGKNTVEIAIALSVGTKTIETHRQHIRDKLALASPVQFSRCAYECATRCRLECADKPTCELDPRYRARPPILLPNPPL